MMTRNVPEPSTERTEPVAEPLMEIDGLSLSFRFDLGWRPVTTKVSIRIEEGTVVGLVGESGSGKSVSSMAILGLNRARDSRVDSGEIRFRGRNLIGLSEKDLNEVRGKRIAMVFQDPMTTLNPSLTVGAQIAEVMVRHKVEDRRRAPARVNELLDLVGLPNPVRQARSYPHTLSGGMRQRVMIAMAIACSPDLLIADEPTTALDVTVQAQILEIIKRLQRDLNMAVLFVTHDLSVVADICDFVYVMYAGEIVESASAEKLFESPLSPYMEALLRSSARDDLRGRALPSIPGSMPRPGEFSQGCRFSPRCDYADDQCKTEVPTLEQLADRRQVRCIRYRELTLRGVR